MDSIDRAAAEMESLEPLDEWKARFWMLHDGERVCPIEILLRIEEKLDRLLAMEGTDEQGQQAD